MILADTSVWISHLRTREAHLAKLLAGGQILTHPFVVGEIACGNLKKRSEVLTNLRHLPEVQVVSHAEVMYVIEERRLWGMGVGWVDAHLLASAAVADCLLWTLDLRLRAAAEKLRVSFS